MTFTAEQIDEATERLDKQIQILEHALEEERGSRS